MKGNPAGERPRKRLERELRARLDTFRLLAARLEETGDGQVKATREARAAHHGPGDPVAPSSSPPRGILKGLRSKKKSKATGDDLSDGGSLGFQSLTGSPGRKKEISFNLAHAEVSTNRLGDEACTVLFPVPGTDEPSEAADSVPSHSLRNLHPSTAAFWTKFLFPQAGEILGERYTIGDHLAAGGTSRVFRGLDRQRDLPVAVKVVPPPLSDVLRHALEVTHPLRHPSVLRVEHHGEVGDGGLYLVMPLLGGSTLRDLLFARLGAQEALLLAFRRACEGVAQAHSQGIVHRDLKPSNLQVEPDGRTVVLDWGLACRAGENAGWRGHVLGTPRYMAPEQLRGETVSPRTDIFALGVILYELVTGVLPGGTGNTHSQLLQKLPPSRPPPTSLLNKDIPPRLDEIVLRSLENDPGARFENAGELLADLEDAL